MYFASCVDMMSFSKVPERMPSIKEWLLEQVWVQFTLWCSLCTQCLSGKGSSLYIEIHFLFLSLGLVATWSPKDWLKLVTSSLSSFPF